MSDCPTAIAFDDIDAIFMQPDSPREGEVIQLEPGKLGLRARLTALPSVHIYTWNYGQRMLGREARNDGSLCLLLRLDSGEPARITACLRLSERSKRSRT